MVVTDEQAVFTTEGSSGGEPGDGAGSAWAPLQLPTSEVAAEPVA